MTHVAVAALTLAALPALGQPLEDGLFAGLTTTKDGRHHAVVLLPAKPSGRLHWQGALAWAEEQGGQLPTRPVGALLYANLKSEFEPTWYWTSEQHEDDGAYAWSQHFLNGHQHGHHTSYEARARAVRLIPLSA